MVTVLLRDGQSSTYLRSSPVHIPALIKLIRLNRIADNQICVPEVTFLSMKTIYQLFEA